MICVDTPVDGLSGIAQGDVSATPGAPHLIVRSGSHKCAFNLLDVVEIMRPVPIEALAGAPEVVGGIAIIRGNPTPVFELAVLLGENSQGNSARFVAVRTGERTVALLVDEVLGAREIPLTLRHQMPPLLSQARSEFVEAVATLDEELLLILGAAGLLSEEAGRLMASGQPS